MGRLLVRRAAANALTIAHVARFGAVDAAISTGILQGEMIRARLSRLFQAR